MKTLRKTDRGVRHFLNLKKDYEDQSDRIADSLPLFIRIMFLDQPNPWIKEINKYDFLQLIAISPQFMDMIFIDKDLKVTKNISPNLENRTEVSPDDFLRASILEIRNVKISVQDFLLSLAYSGGIHMEPEKTEHHMVYDSLLDKYPDQALRIARDIAKCFIDMFQEFYTLLVGGNDGYSPHNSFQPRIVVKGVLQEGMLFQNSFIQFPVRGLKNHGIRFCLHLKFSEDHIKESIILEYGNRNGEGRKISLIKSGNFVILKVKNAKGSDQIIKWDIEADVKSKFNLIEVAVYPSGYFLLAVNTYLRAFDRLEGSLDTTDGKVILGSNLNGTRFGEFYGKTFAIQAIDIRNNCMPQGLYSLGSMPSRVINLPFELMTRTFL